MMLINFIKGVLYEEEKIMTIIPTEKILKEYENIKHNEQGIVRQMLDISKKLGADTAEIIRVIYESEATL